MHRCLLSLAAVFMSVVSNAQIDSLAVKVIHGTACRTPITRTQMEALTRHSATIKSHDGAEATYDGAWVKDVLNLACPSAAAIDKRTMVRSAVRVTAGDGYTALVALTEADSTFRERPILLAWKKNGQALDGHDGPFQLIVPDDLRHARDVRQVKVLEVITP
jgi:hypothetical protein